MKVTLLLSSTFTSALGVVREQRIAAAIKRISASDEKVQAGEKMFLGSRATSVVLKEGSLPLLLVACSIDVRSPPPPRPASANGHPIDLSCSYKRSRYTQEFLSMGWTGVRSPLRLTCRSKLVFFVVMYAIGTDGRGSPALPTSTSPLARCIARPSGKQLAFFTHVSHEFRTPLSVVIGYTEDVGAVQLRSG